jgi:hypothetical protein
MPYLREREREFFCVVVLFLGPFLLFVNGRKVIFQNFMGQMKAPHRTVTVCGVHRVLRRMVKIESIECLLCIYIPKHDYRLHSGAATAQKRTLFFPKKLDNYVPLIVPKTRSPNTITVKVIKIQNKYMG